MDNQLGEYTSRRKIDFFTPGKMSEPLTVLSTVITKEGGETATCKIDAMNYLDADLRGQKWEVIQEHKNPAQAIKFHEKKAREIIAKGGSKI